MAGRPIGLRGMNSQRQKWPSKEPSPSASQVPVGAWLLFARMVLCWGGMWRSGDSTEASVARVWTRRKYGVCSDPDTMREDEPRGEMEDFWDGSESGPPAGMLVRQRTETAGKKGHSSKTALLSESRADDGLELWIQEPRPQMNGPRDEALTGKGAVAEGMKDWPGRCAGEQ